MSTLKLASLDGSGLEWIRDSLSLGGELSRAALAVLNIEAGSAYTYVPNDATLPRLDDILFYPGDRYGMEDAAAAARAMGDTIAASFAGTFLVDRDDRVSDYKRGGLLDVKPTEALFAGGSVIEWRKVRDAASDLAAFLGGLSHGDNALVTRDLAHAFAPGEDITELVPHLAASVDAVLVGAFDDVGYVLWTPQPLSQELSTPLTEAATLPADRPSTH